MKGSSTFSMNDQTPIFVSIGKTYNHDQRAVIDLIYVRLKQEGFVPITLDRVMWDPSDPIRAIVSLMKRCSGVMVIAFPRFRYHDILEFPDAPDPNFLGDRLVPTMWNQIEAALAYALKLPLMSLVDSRMHNEALLNPAHSAYNVTSFDMGSAGSELPSEVLEAIDVFMRQVRTRKKANRSTSADRRLAESLAKTMRDAANNDHGL